MNKNKGKTVQQNLKLEMWTISGWHPVMLVKQKKASFAEDELTQNLRGSGKEVRIRRQLRPLGLVGPRTYHTGKDPKKTAWKKMSWRKLKSPENSWDNGHYMRLWMRLTCISVKKGDKLP